MAEKPRNYKDILQDFEQHKDIDKLIEDYSNLDIYALEKRYINDGIFGTLDSINEGIKEMYDKMGKPELFEPLDLGIKRENIQLSTQIAHKNSIQLMKNNPSIENITNIIKRGAVLNVGANNMEMSAYLNLKMKRNLVQERETSTRTFASKYNYQVVVYNQVGTPNETCADFIGNVYDANDSTNLPPYHDNCKCLTMAVFDSSDTQNIPLISGEDATEYEKLRSSHTRLDRFIRQNRRLGNDVSGLKDRQKEIQDKAKELISKQNLNKNQKNNLTFFY